MIQLDELIVCLCGYILEVGAGMCGTVTSTGYILS